MGKALNEFMEAYKLESSGKTTWGIINGYQVSTFIDSFQAPCFRGQIFTHLSEEEKNIITEQLNLKKKELKIFKYEFNEYGFNFWIGGAILTNNSAVNYLRTALETLTVYMQDQNFKNSNYCPISGEELVEKRLVGISDFKAYISEAEALKLDEANAKAEEEYRNSPNNYLKGTLGAICGGAIGAVVWIVIGAFLGIVSGWVAFLISFLAGFGYDKLHGKANNMKIIVASLVTLFFIIFSMFLIYVILVRQAMVQEGLEGNPISLLFELLDVSDDIRSSFISDLVLGLLFGVFGIVFSAIAMRKTLHKKPQK